MYVNEHRWARGTHRSIAFSRPATDAPGNVRVGIQTWGTEGDIRPCFSLANALRSRGHDVRIVYTNVEGRDFGDLARRCRVDATSVGSEYFEAHRDRLALRATESFELGNPLEQLRRIASDLIDPVATDMLAAGDSLAQDVDVMVVHFLAYPGFTAAERHRRPIVMIALAPAFASAHYAPIGFPALGRWLNPLSWKLAERILESIFRDRANRLRYSVGLAPIRGLARRNVTDTLLGLVAISPALFPRPPDWASNLHVSGFLNLPESAEPWEPDVALREFLDRGSPPAFLSFGSMFNLGHDRTVAAVRALAESLPRARSRGIIQAPDAVIGDAPRHDLVHYITRAPHAKLFPRCSMIVHHGGAGTTQSALQAGRPSVVVPHAADQFYWGDLLFSLGVASKPLRSTRLTPTRLAERIRYAIERPAMTERAAVLGRSLASERGPERAVELIEAAMSASRG